MMSEPRTFWGKIHIHMSKTESNRCGWITKKHKVRLDCYNPWLLKQFIDQAFEFFFQMQICVH